MGKRNMIVDGSTQWCKIICNNNFEKTQLVEIYFMTRESFQDRSKTRAGNFYDVHHPFHLSLRFSGHLTALSSHIKFKPHSVDGLQLNARYLILKKLKILHYSLLYRNARMTGVEPIPNLTAE